MLQECSNYPGFVTKFRVSNQFSEANDHVGYENYRHVCHKWHYKITKAMVVCLDSKDYVQIRNSLIILIKILPHFPVLAKLSQIIERKIEKVIYIRKSVYNNSLFYQFDAQFLYFNTLFTSLCVFRALLCSSSGGQIVLVQHLVSLLSLGDCSVHRLRKDFLNLCTEQSPKECGDTRCCTNTI